MREHAQPDEMSHTFGIPVNTLSFTLDAETLKHGTCQLLRLEPGNFRAQGTPWCYLLGDQLVVCKGVVHGRFPNDHNPSTGRNIRIACLPVEMRPRRALEFAALCREAVDLNGHLSYTSCLMKLVVTPDGWICGVSTKEAKGAVDLSAIRFVVGGGISLMDEVTLHTVDLAGTRVMALQGTLQERFFVLHGGSKPLATLPESCKPPETLAFITAGAKSGFHVLQAEPLHSCGLGGNLMWRDSTWSHDLIHLSGLMYEVAPESVHVSSVGSSWTPEILKAFIKDFRKFLTRRFGSLEDAWTGAFCRDQSGSIGFTDFSRGCKAIGYVGNASRLWAAMDVDADGALSKEEVAVSSSLLSPLRSQKLARANTAHSMEGRMLTFATMKTILLEAPEPIAEGSAEANGTESLCLGSEEGEERVPLPGQPTHP